MNQARLIGLLICPSLLSGSLGFLLASGLVVATNWLRNSPDNPLYDYLFGAYGITTVFQNSSNALTAVNGAFSSTLAYNIALLVFALFIGLLVYIFLRGIDAVTDHAKEEIRQVGYVNDRAVKKRMQKTASLRVGLRLTTLVALIIYLVFLIRVIVPYAIVLGRIDRSDPWNMATGVKGLLAFTVLAAAFHLVVIFMRLIVLRPRLLRRSIIVGVDGGH